jgi:16S rRNA C967 or C1407 C5-methylase (RsmB/RsmF family)
MLPEKFLERMKNQLGEEFPGFLESLERPRAVALRFNPLKGDSPQLPFVREEVPWEPTYGYALTTDPYEAHVAASAPSAQCNAAEVNGKFVVFTSAVNAGFALLEFPKAK